MKTVLDVEVLGAPLVLMVAVEMELAGRDSCEVARRKRVMLGTLLLPAILLPLLGFALAGAIAGSLLNWIDSAAVTAVYSLIEVPLLLSVVGAYHRWWTPSPFGRPASARS